VVHFDGHGVLNGRRVPGYGAPDTYQGPGPEGVLVFEKPGGGADDVPASKVAQVLKAAGVPVVVLNACQSGAIGKDLEADWLIPVHYLRRDVSFPQARTARTGPLSLDAELDEIRRATGGPGTGELDPVGSFTGRDGLFYLLEVAARRQRAVVPRWAPACTAFIRLSPPTWPPSGVRRNQQVTVTYRRRRPARLAPPAPPSAVG
jgi:hypothetical protein